MSNRLTREKSPYLLQHKDNPVEWYPWCEEAFQRAAKEDKPVFLSIGYSTCHWCHVMAHESFEDTRVAEILNRGFVCIKVDREERPDIDAVYMAACQAMTGSGGWPLTVFMTPGQKPFFAGTYFPKVSRYGQMGLIELLERITCLWKGDRGTLLSAGERMTAFLSKSHASGGSEPNRALLTEAFRLLRQNFDPLWGGFGSAPKFPAPHNLLFLMGYFQLEKEPEALKMAESTLQAMAQGGIMDHIAGGFSRYSTDETWLVPHFEKMLYDNALLLMSYLEAFRLTQKEFYADVAQRTADYILRELTDPSGGFYCGQDADSGGVEGSYYVFTKEELLCVLGRIDGEEFCRLYGITREGNFGGKNIPNRIGQKEAGWKEEDPRLKRLYEYRKRRASLHRDDKILLSWSSWAIIALARAGLFLEKQEYLQAAFRAQQFIEKNMTDGRNRLYVRFRDGEAAYDGQLEDYAVYGLALLELYRITLDAGYLALAVFRVRQMREFFEDKEEGGYFMNASDSRQLIARPKESYDGAMPSGNSAAAMVLGTLAKLTGEKEWREAADRQNRFLAGQAGEYPAGYSFGLLSMARDFYPGRELLCVGEAVPLALVKYLKEHGTDSLSILFKSKENESILSELAPFTRDYPIPERGAAWYLCAGGACCAPVTEFQRLEL